MQNHDQNNVDKSGVNWSDDENFWAEARTKCRHNKILCTVSDCLHGSLVGCRKICDVQSLWLTREIQAVRRATHHACIPDSFLKRRRQTFDTSPAIMYVSSVVSASIAHQKCRTHR
jgi:hypothetical protein